MVKEFKFPEKHNPPEENQGSGLNPEKEVIDLNSRRKSAISTPRVARMITELAILRSRISKVYQPKLEAKHSKEVSKYSKQEILDLIQKSTLAEWTQKPLFFWVLLKIAREKRKLSF